MGRRVKIKPPGIGPQVLVIPFTRVPFWGYPIFDRHPYEEKVLWMDESHFAAASAPKKLWETIVGIYKGSIIPGCLRWCRISSVHSMISKSFSHNSGEDSGGRSKLPHTRPGAQPFVS